MPPRKRPPVMTWDWRTWPWTWCKAVRDAKWDEGPRCYLCGGQAYFRGWNCAWGLRYRTIGPDTFLFCVMCIDDVGRDEGERAA